ncbi:type II secretion system protein [Candidatus Nomurabacteria bacterium]|nr:type II secretion system protein [Candidatus Nomurabacteria bacterium]
MAKIQKTYEGFTLIEILVVVGLIAILAAVTIVAINPAKNFEQTRDAQRSADVTAILNAVTQYTSEEGQTIETLLAAIGSPDIDETGLDVDTDGNRSEGMLCSLLADGIKKIGKGVDTYLTATTPDLDGSGVSDALEYVDLEQTNVLVDEYIVTIPEDPSQSTTWTTLTDTGYTFCVTASGRVTITADPERAASISVSR